MKVVLINVDEKGTFYASHGQSWGHLGLLSVGTVLEQEGFEVVLWDELITGNAPIEELVSPGDVVGFSVVVTGVVRGLKLAQRAKEAGARVVLAGNDQASYRSKQLLNSGYIDGVFAGDDLTPIRQVFRSIRSTGKLPEEDVVGFVRNGHKRSTRGSEYFIVPNLHLFSDSHWEKSWHNHRILNGFEYTSPNQLKNSLILLAGGCSRGLNTCPYCAINEVWNIRKPQREYFEKVISEYKDFGINDFFNVTDSFYEMSAVIDTLVEMGIRLPNLTIYARAWGLSHRPQNAEKLLSLIQPGGVLKFNMGLDSGDDWILESGIMKGHGLRENIEAIKLIKKLGIHLHCSFIFGAPGETHETCQRTMEFIDFIMSELSSQLSQVETDIWWVNFGAPCDEIFYSYEAARKYAELAGKTISKQNWEREFHQHRDALYVPYSAEQAWYKYFTHITLEKAENYVNQVVMKKMHQNRVLTGRGFGGHPYNK